MRDRRSRHSPAAAGRLPGPDDVGLGVRLERALRDEHANAHVDVARLVRGTRRATTRRVRVRRFTVLAATGLAVAAIPVGFQAAQWSAPSAAPPAGVPASTPAETPPDAPTPSPAATAVPSTPTATPGAERSSGGEKALPRRLAGYDDTLYDIPDAAAIPLRVLPVTMVELYDSGQYRGQPTVMGQACGSPTDPDESVAGRAWMWAEEESNRLDQYSVDLVLTGWAPGASAREMERVAENTGDCRFGAVGSDAQGVEVTDDGWSAWTRRPDGIYSGHAARRLAGDVIVSVSVDSPVGRKDALSQARRLLDVAVDRARAAGVEALLDGALAPSGAGPKASPSQP